MRLNEKGWLRDYLELRKGLLADKSNDGSLRASHPEHALYRILQPTGLMYGQSFGELTIPEATQLDRKSRLRIQLVESLISSSLLSYNNASNGNKDPSEIIRKALESIGNFYSNIFPELAIRGRTILGTKKSSIELAERILDRRIEYASTFAGNFWSAFFHNSLLFLDIFIYGQWIHTNSDHIVTNFFRYEREELRFSVIKVIAAAAHANNVVALEERRLYEHFIESADLTTEQKKEAQSIFEKGFNIEDFNLPSGNSWILKKYFLEISILTIWADRHFEEAESDFLQKFCRYLDLSEDDLENSMIAIESFVLDHWEHLEILKDRQDYNQIGEHLIKRLASVAEKNRTRLIKGLRQNPGATALAKKARATELNSDDKELVRLELLRMLKSIPAFAILSLPERFLTLPVLLRILPRNLFAEGTK